MGDVLHLDFETRSASDLFAEGLHLYAEHPTTEVLCAAWAFNDGEVSLWHRDGGDSLDPVFRHVADGGLVYAHNAAFEYEIWRNVSLSPYGQPEMRPDQLRCTAAIARFNGLPGDLKRAAWAVGMPEQKDDRGRFLINKLCKPMNPNSPIVTWN
jgi:DNA polymerase